MALIGLDGVPPQLLDQLTADGTMPCMAALLSSGWHGTMRSSLPPVSSVAWTSCMTGANPGRHGIFGFMEPRPASGGIYFPNSTHVQLAPIWELLAEQQRTCMVLNVPHTYPAQAMRGIMVAGFVALDLERAVFPPQLAPALRRVGYHIDLEAGDAREQPAAFVQQALESVAARHRVFAYLAGRADWDLFVGVFTETDRIQHFFWDALQEPAHPLHAAVRAVYRRIDAAIGELVAGFGEETGLLICSDHGFGPLRQEVRLNAWLRRQGLLIMRPDEPCDYSAIDHARSRGYVLDPGRVYITGDDREAALAAVGDALRVLRDPATGDPVITAMHPGAHIYTGPCCGRAPDLVLEAAPGCDLKGAIAHTEVFGMGRCTGMHTSDAFLCIRGAARVGRQPLIEDVAPTIMRLLDAGLPADRDGQPLL